LFVGTNDDCKVLYRDYLFSLDRVNTWLPWASPEGTSQNDIPELIVKSEISKT
jgi:hypothetical protein